MKSPSPDNPIADDGTHWIGWISPAGKARLIQRNRRIEEERLMSYLPKNYRAEEALGCPPGMGGGWLEAAKKIGKGAIDIYSSTQQQKGEAAAYKAQMEAQAAAAVAAQQKTPSWILPAAVGGAALVVILLMKKR